MRAPKICANAMRLLFAFLFISASLSTPFFFKKGFKLPPVYEHIPPYNPNWEFSLPNLDIQNILHQKFSYFSNGNQSTVFLSEDGKYVLKLFRYTRSRFTFLHKLKNAFKKNPKMDLMTKINKTLNAACLGCTDAKKFTQAIYCHLNLSKNQLPIVELDYKKSLYHLPIDRYRFIIQRKLTPFKEALIEVRNDSEQIENYMLSFATLLFERSCLNIRNSDPNLGPDFGFFNGEAVELDFGNYHRIEPSKARRIKEYDNLMNRFEDWISAAMPEYLSMLKSLRLKVRTSYDADT